MTFDNDVKPSNSLVLVYEDVRIKRNDGECSRVVKVS